ncbi:MAG: hypothetical protein ACJ74T_03190 [Pyrinomonadaceae bacterium]
MNPFSFESTLKLTESEYLDVWTLVPAARLTGVIGRAALAAVGVIFLFSSYTLLLGVMLLLYTTVSFFAPRMIPVGTRSTFYQHTYLRDALSCGVSERRLWVRSTRLDASAAWSMLVTWRERAGWLVLSPSGIPPVYLPINRLKEEGLYEHVLELARQHGREFKIR